MSDEYTPTTEEIRRDHRIFRSSTDAMMLKREAGFDRWLREHDAKVWDELAAEMARTIANGAGDVAVFPAEVKSWAEDRAAALRVGANPTEEGNR